MTETTKRADSLPEVRPRSFALELTKGCNLRCSYCYYADREDAYDPATRMSQEVAFGSVDRLLDDGPPDGRLHLHFFGGEPLLNFPLLKATVEYAVRRAAEQKREFTFEVTTNGTPLNDEIVAFLNVHKVQVGVSFDGPPEIQDVARPSGTGSSYERALPGIRALLDSRRGTPLESETHCSVVLTRLSTDFLGIAQHLEDLGFRHIIVTPATDLGNRTNGFSDEDLDEVLRAFDVLAADYERRRAAGEQVAVTWYNNLMGRLLSGEKKTQFCGGGRDYLGVSADGDVSLCYRFFESGDEFAMGSVKDGLHGEVTQKLEEHALDERTACGVCWARYFCGGGCHHDNVTLGGGLGDPNPVVCDIFRHTMGQTLDMWARLTRQGQRLERAQPSGEGTPVNDPVIEFDASDKLVRVPGSHERELDGEKLVYQPESHEVVVLNRTAQFILELCDGEHTVNDVLDAMESRYKVDRAVLDRDLRATLADLCAKAVVRVEPAS